MSWIEIKLHIPFEKIESISAYLFAQGCEGINLTDNNIMVYFNQMRWSNETKLALIDYIKEFIPRFSLRDIQVVRVADQDWNKKWKKFFKPVRVSERIVVRPPWEKPGRNKDKIDIIINPKMAFGTGHHESTQLMIIGLEKWIRVGMNVLDVGTGSGILAIIADKLGADSVMAFDSDPAAINNAFENAQLNNTSKKVTFFLASPEMISPSEYDLVLANINRNVLIKYADLFPGLLKSNGKLILSGLLLLDEHIMIETFNRAGFDLIEKNAMKEWLLLVLELRNKPVDGQNHLEN
jgi:ribosomal protein L11 methyltransferase